MDNNGDCCIRTIDGYEDCNIDTFIRKMENCNNIVLIGVIDQCRDSIDIGSGTNGPSNMGKIMKG